MSTYQDIYPSKPVIRSQDVARPRAADLMNVEYFEAEPGEMPALAFAQHHVLINLRETPHRVENWRDGDHRDFMFRQNEIVVTPAGVVSGWRWHERSRCIVVTIEPDKLERFTERELGVLLTRQQLADLPQFEDEDITNAARQLVDALQSDAIGSDVMYESFARVFLVKLIQKYGRERSEEADYSASFTASHYKRVLDFVAQNFGKPLTIEDIAREAGLSASHFSRLFKQVIGDTPHQFLMRYRIERAQEMLAERDRPLIDIALACGFADQPHFSRVFKAYAGETPRAFRGRILQKSDR